MYTYSGKERLTFKGLVRIEIMKLTFFLSLLIYDPKQDFRSGLLTSLAAYFILCIIMEE